MGKKQEVETLINEEAPLFAVYLRDEKKEWIPRIVMPTKKISVFYFFEKVTSQYLSPAATDFIIPMLIG
jgi:hypothetical protein